ncbi:nuclear body protein SP140-like isoform X2 [Triplophysa rosa]|uniref:nuclear body protein SP140-like isoform X2 n=1 Tax=Triplophysa rosa TaxID=992332 RepID=UPI0025460C3E|nr:nuclear body protein SP140-like isoform X2 [Triplophysa rosa]
MCKGIKRQQGFEQYKCFRELQEMDEDAVTESESEWNPESSSSFDWSEDEGKKRQRWKKRTLKTRSCNVSEQTGTTLVKKRGATSKSCENASQSLEEQIENDSQLLVTCGNKEGCLDLEKFGKKENCIFSKGRWFKPTEFEKFGGKEKNKKWKYSILCCGVPLQKLIEDKRILTPNFKKSRIQVEQSNGSPGRLRGMKRNSFKSSRAAPTTSRAADRARETKSRKKRFPSSSESERKYNGHHEDNGNNNKEDEIDMTFQGPTLPVTCGSLFGILHKRRFATGFCGKCIRIEDFWLTPEEFVRLSKQDGAWKKDIVTHGRPLGKLIMEKVLELHALNCECDVCLKLDQDTNDDVCNMCDSEEDLVCCDECPRAFHPHCHLPAVDEDSGGQWCCTFCRMKKVKGSTQKTRQDVLNSPLSQYRLHCQYLLLHLLHEVSVNKDMCETHDVKQNLQNDTYQTVGEFVTDIEHIFQHCTSVGDDDLSRMQRLFKREFETIFKPL